MCPLKHTERERSASIVVCILCTLVPCAMAKTPANVGEDGSTHSASSGAIRSVVFATATAQVNRDVAIIAAASGNVADPFFTDARDRLLASGDFTSVTIIDAGQTTPTLVELTAFDAVVVWSNFSFADADGLGDNLAAFVDQGGGVVIAVFANSAQSTSRFLGGRWLSHGYEIVPSQGGTTTGLATLGTIRDPAHPLVTGITTFSGGSASFRPTNTSIALPARVIAEWSDGATLVAVRDDTVGSRVDLGFYPPSDVIPGFPEFWDSLTDGDLLLVNALRFAADRLPLTPGDSDGDGDVDRADAGQFDVCAANSFPGMVSAGCVTFDFDANQTVDCADWSSFLLAYTEPGLPPSSKACVIPTVSQWGLLALCLLLLVTGTLLASRRRADGRDLGTGQVAPT